MWYSKFRSRCCHQPQVLVLSRSGGFVTQNCTACGRPRYVGIGQLPDAECDACGSTMRVSVRDRNYFYECACCGDGFPLWTQLPRWDELFEKCGIAVPSELDW